MWQWPATFIETYLERLIEMGRIDHKFAEQVRAALASAEKNPNARMLTPLVLEIIAEKFSRYPGFAMKLRRGPGRGALHHLSARR